MNKYVFDTSALLTFIEDEEGIEIVESLLIKSVEKEIEIFISAVTLIELFYISAREQSVEIAEQRLELLNSIPLKQEALKPQFTQMIGKLKASHSMSFADCCIAGLAKYKNAVLVHKDPEFEQVASEINLLTLPYKKKNK